MGLFHHPPTWPLRSEGIIKRVPCHVAAGEPHIVQLRHEKINLPPAPLPTCAFCAPTNQVHRTCLKQQVPLHPDSPSCDSVWSHTINPGAQRHLYSQDNAHKCEHTLLARLLARASALLAAPCRSAPMPTSRTECTAPHCTHTCSLRAARLSFVSGCCVQWGQSHSHPQPPRPPLAHPAPRVGTHTRYGSAARQLLGKGKKKTPHRFSREREGERKRERMTDCNPP